LGASSASGSLSSLFCSWEVAYCLWSNVHSCCSFFFCCCKTHATADFSIQVVSTSLWWLLSVSWFFIISGSILSASVKYPPDIAIGIQHFNWGKKSLHVTVHWQTQSLQDWEQLWSDIHFGWVSDSLMMQ
jgi:hypothetical protein